MYNYKICKFSLRNIIHYHKFISKRHTTLDLSSYLKSKTQILVVMTLLSGLKRTTDWKPLSFSHPSIALSCLFYHFLISLSLPLASSDSLKGVDDQSIGSSLPHALAQWNITLRYIFRVQHSVPGQPYRLGPENLKSSHVMLSGSMSNVFFKIQTLLLSNVLQMPTFNKA